MRFHEWLRLIGGSFVLVSVILGAVHSPYWFFFTGLVALNLIQSAFTKWCPMIAILRKVGVKE